MSSCDTAAYIWHSSITAFKPRRPDLVVPAQIGICSQARTSYLVFDTLLPWHAVTAACGTARGIVLSDGIHARLWLSTQNHTEFPRALLNVMSGTFTVVQRLLCGFVVAAFSGRGRRSGREVYFCQPVISDPSNYTLINQAWRPDGCGPLQLQSLVIPHIHLFSFSPNSVLSPWFFGRKDIDGFDQLRGNAETHGTFRPHGRELLVPCSQTSSHFDRSWGGSWTRSQRACLRTMQALTS